MLVARTVASLCSSGALAGRLTPIAEPPDSPDLARLAQLLEAFVPHALERAHPAWAHEGIDAVRIDGAAVPRPNALELFGVALLLSDQSWIPFRATLIADADGQSPVGWHVRAGEPGGGTLGISGPEYGTSDATRYRFGLPDRIDAVKWVYEAAHGASRDEAI